MWPMFEISIVLCNPDISRHIYKLYVPSKFHSWKFRNMV